MTITITRHASLSTCGTYRGDLKRSWNTKPNIW